MIFELPSLSDSGTFALKTLLQIDSYLCFMRGGGRNHNHNIEHVELSIAAHGMQFLGIAALFEHTIAGSASQRVAPSIYLTTMTLYNWIPCCLHFALSLMERVNKARSSMSPHMSKACIPPETTFALGGGPARHCDEMGSFPAILMS